MIGLPVYVVETGKRIGEVQDIRLNGEWEIQGIELEGKGLFSSKIRMVPWNDIVAYGEDAVMIANNQVIRETDPVDIQHTFNGGNCKIKDLPVLTPEGTELGKVADVYFDQKMGNTLIGLEITDGFISDILEGRKWLRLTDAMKIGEHAIMVPAQSEQSLEKIITSANG